MVIYRLGLREVIARMMLNPNANMIGRHIVQQSEMARLCRDCGDMVWHCKLI
jgi:hypothetical protein